MHRALERLISIDRLICLSELGISFLPNGGSCDGHRSGIPHTWEEPQQRGSCQEVVEMATKMGYRGRKYPGPQMSQQTHYSNNPVPPVPYVTLIGPSAKLPWDYTKKQNLRWKNLGVRGHPGLTPSLSGPSPYQQCWVLGETHDLSRANQSWPWKFCCNYWGKGWDVRQGLLEGYFAPWK